VVDDALARVLDTEVQTVGAGRTDAGVHALGQVMSTTIEAPDDLDLERLRGALDALCGPAMVIRSCTQAPDDFHARFSALSRTYVYAVYLSRSADPWLGRTALHHPGDLDIEAMNEAAGHLTGSHDFRSFGRTQEPEASAERVLYELRCTRNGDIVRIHARANAFIQQMVRSLVGTLLQVGEGKRAPDEMTTVLEVKDRAAAGPVAAPHGLCLVAVEYDSGWSGPSGPRAL
jgi:tRNA pseudouridine38-40 synthase